MGTPIRILHLSDLHFSDDSHWEARTVLDRLPVAVEDLCAEGLAPDVVAITGDIAQSGTKSDYELAGEWIERQLLPCLPSGLPSDKILIVPGNHDVERSAVREAARGIQAHLLKHQDQTVIKDVLTEKEARGLLLKRHGEYLNFASRYGGGDGLVPWWTRTLKIDGANVHLVGVCSSWMSWGDEDQGRLLVGRWQINELMKHTSKEDLSVVLIHHPRTFLAEFDAMAFEDALLHSTCVILRGHQHQQTARIIQDPDHRQPELAAGCGYGGVDHLNAFQLVEIYPRDFKLRVHFRIWHNQQWSKDTVTYRNAPEGNTVFYLRGLVRHLPTRNDKFVGRQPELEKIHRCLTGDSQPGTTLKCVVSGIGGVGKTSIAVEYAWQHLDDYPGGLFLLRCETGLLSQMAELAKPLGLPEASAPEITAERVKYRLENGEKALLILDNVTSAGQLAEKEWFRYLPTGRCHLLVTTRDPDLWDVPTCNVSGLPTKDGFELLARYRTDADVPDHREAVRKIVEWFESLPVGLTVVGIYMRLCNDVSWESYQQELENVGLEAVRGAEDAGTRPKDYPKGVVEVFDELLDRLQPERRRALEYAALLPKDCIVWSWLAELLSSDPDLTLPYYPGSEDPAEHVVRKIVQRDLLRVGGEDAKLLSMHRVLRRRLNDLLGKPEEISHRKALLERLANLLCKGRFLRAALAEGMEDYLVMTIADSEWHGHPRETVFRAFADALRKSEKYWTRLRASLNARYGRYPEWPNELRQSLEGSDSIKAIRFLADTHDMEGRFDEAIAIYENLLDEIGPDSEKAVKHGLRVRLAMYLDHKAARLHRDGKWERAQEMWQAALDRLEEYIAGVEMNRTRTRELWWATYQKGIILRQLQRFASALHVQETLYAGAKEPGHRVSALHQLGVIDLLLGDCDSAIDRFTLCKEMRGERKWDHRRAFELRRLGQAYALTNHPQNAVDAFEEAITISRRCGNQRYVEESRNDLCAFVEVPAELMGTVPSRVVLADLAERFKLTTHHLADSFRVLSKSRKGYLELLGEDSPQRTGTVAPWESMHGEEGLWHATVTVLLVDERERVAMQRRQEPDSFGKWDVSAAGHVEVGDSAEWTAVLEVYEEIGLLLDATELNLLGEPFEFQKVGDPQIAADHRAENDPTQYYYRRGTLNREWTSVFVAFVETNEHHLILQRPERAPEIKWLTVSEAYHETTQNGAQYASAFKHLFGHQATCERITRMIQQRRMPPTT